MNKYMLRKAVGIERLLNLQFLVYAILSLIPFLSSAFESFVDLSIQDRRFVLGKEIDLSVILCTYAAAPQQHKNALSFETITQLLSDNIFGSVLSA